MVDTFHGLLETTSLSFSGTQKHTLFVSNFVFDRLRLRNENHSNLLATAEPKIENW